MSLSLWKKAFLAKLAYESDIGLIREQLMVMFQIGIMDIEFIYVPRTDTEGFMIRVGSECIVCFSGTESIIDLKQDLIFLPAPYKGGFLHYGFRQIIQEIRSPVLDAFKILFGTYHPSRIYAIGHSLGAPVAMGACEALKEGYSDIPREITTFGCPNGWSYDARAGFNARHPYTTNYINPGDYVTWLLGITSGRPGRNIKLAGKWGHKMDKYIHNIKGSEL